MRSISWPEYNLSRIEEAKETLEFIRDTVDEIETPIFKGKVGKPLTNPKSLVKAILTAEALGFTERNAQGWLSILSPFLGIGEHLDDRTIGDAYDKIEVVHILKQVFEKTKHSDGKLSGDGTGLETSRKQNYETDKKAGDYMTSIVDSREIVQAFDVNGEQECKAMHKLIDGVHGDSLRLDAGFNDRELVRKIAEKGMTPYVFPKSNNNLNGTLAWKHMYLELLLDVMHWLTEYHQRSHSESFHASFKTKYSLITKRRPTAKLSQVTARIILHNRRRLSYFNKINPAS
ncbi:MAG: transposase [Candidatus Woesearchaeota archaeon]